MWRAQFSLGGMGQKIGEVTATDRGFSLLLGFLVAWNEVLLRAMLASGMRLPSLDKAGIRYVAEPPPAEEWLDVLALYRNGEGDCEDLACAEAAMWRVYHGVEARPAFARRQVDMPGMGNVRLFHCFVLLPGDRISDPSRRLGMVPIR